MKQIIFILFIIFVVYIFMQRRKNAKICAEETAKHIQAHKSTPEEDAANQALKRYRDNPCEETRKALEAALDADTNHWQTDFILALRFDTGIDGFPLNREYAQTWYKRALAKAKSFGSSQYIRDLEKFFTYYDRPYGNYKDLNPDVEQARRIQTCLLLCSSRLGIISCRIRSSAEGYILDHSNAIRMIRQLPSHSPMVIRLLEDYQKEAQLGNHGVMEPAEQNQRFNAFLKLQPDPGRMQEPYTDYHFFLFGMFALMNDPTPYYGRLRKLWEDELQTSLEKAYVQYFLWGLSGGSSECMYMLLKERAAVEKIKNWDKTASDYNYNDFFMEYTGNVGWPGYAQKMAAEFFPGTDEHNWILD